MDQNEGEIGTLNQNGRLTVGVTVWYPGCFLCIWLGYICIQNVIHVCACRRRGLDFQCSRGSYRVQW